MVQLTSVHDYYKNHSFGYTNFCWWSDVLPFNTLSRFVIAFLPRSKRLLISWLHWFWNKKKGGCYCFHCFPIYLPWSNGTRCHDLIFWMLSFKPAFSLSSFTFIKKPLSASSLSAIRVVTLHIRGYWYLSRQSLFHRELHPDQHSHDVLYI